MALRYPLVLNGTTIEELQSADSLDVTSASISGDLTFTGTGARVKANFSDPIANNRLLFQTSAANSTTAVGIAPSGTGSTAIIYGANNSDLTNASYFDLRVSGSGNDVRLTSDYFGAGSYLPITFYTGGLEQVRITANSGGPANFQFSQSGTRVIGDFSNPIASNRVLFQTSTANSTTAVGIMPSGTGSTSIIYGTNSSTLTNASYFDLRVSGSGNDVRLTSDYYGAGTYLPITFYTGGSERVRIDTSGNFSIAGLTASRALATDASKNLVSSTVTSTELGYLSGVTSAIQTQLNSKAGTADANTFTNNQIISVNSSSDALRITQTGAGNALVVEDSANPDSTPFVVDAFGDVLIGTPIAIPGPFSDVGKLQIAQNTGEAVQHAFTFTADAYGSYLYLNKSRSSTIGTNSLVQSGDSLGGILFAGADGTTYHRAASIDASVDGTPGTNDMPGRLMFSTTRDGASNPTEAFRISSSQNVLFGRTYAGGERIGIGGGTSSLTTITSALGILNDTTVSSAQTNAYTANSTYLSTQAAAFTLSFLRHYTASQFTIGAGSTVTNQYGFFADGSMVGATNNYGFHSNIASGSGRYNFYAAGTADNYFAGTLNLGDPTNVGAAQFNNLSITGSGGVGYGIKQHNTALSSVTSTFIQNQSVLYTQAASFTLSTYVHFAADQGAIGAGSTVTNQYGFLANSSLIGATNNFGFYSNIASGSGRYNFYAAGTADNYFAGSVGIGALATTASQKLFVAGGGLTASSFQTIDNQTYIPSTGTGSILNYRSVIGTNAASFVVGTAVHFTTSQAALGAGSSITNQIGFEVQSSLTGAANNYGFYSNIASGSGRFNFYAAGTADNYFAGKVGFGGISVGGAYGNVSNQIALTGATAVASYGAIVTINSDVTSSATVYKSQPTTQASAFTLSTLYHFSAQQYGFGAGSTVTSQIGYLADVTLTLATNNYGFYSNIASGSGRYNFYAAGTADNYFAGLVLSNSSIKSNSATAGIGYGTGAGGTVTQTISRTTGVTLNKICGCVTVFSAAATVAANFTVTNSTVSATDTILCSVQASGATEPYLAIAYAVDNGSFKIYMSSPGTTTEAPTINFTVIKSVTA